MTPDDLPTSATLRDIWQRLAPWWDAQIGEGNDFQTLLIEPATDRLLNPQAGQTILDLACGNGQYSRKLGRRGANVIAVDLAPAFIEAAKRRTTSEDGAIDYHVIDATDADQMRSLGECKFDSVVCNMAIMDMPEIAPVFANVRRLLKPGGKFVCSVSHPCFNSAHSRMTAELINEDGRLEQVYGVHITSYIQPRTDRSAGILNQPEPHYLFHRSMSAILSDAFGAGFVLDGMEEPTYSPDIGARNAFSWKKRPQIPPAVVMRFR